MNRQIKDSVTGLMEQIAAVLSELNEFQYATSLPVLTGASIGGHVRHVVEFFQELEVGYETGLVDYDARKREKELEIRRSYAILKLRQIPQNLKADNKPLGLAFKASSAEIGHRIATSYDRELIYNLEHAVHHMALIRIGVRALTGIGLPDEFGVASSTIAYRKAQCVQ